MVATRMFPFITETWNPVAGPCPYDCSYCWAKTLIKRYSYAKYQGRIVLDDRAMSKIPDKGFIFVQDMSDISVLLEPATNVLMTEFSKNKEAQYLLLTKNPVWYLNMMTDVHFPDNVIFGATIETDKQIPVSKAPSPSTRFWAMKQVKEWLPDAKTFISVEPIMDFSMDGLVRGILEAKPWAVAVGYDNYNNHLPEPSLEKTRALIDCLRSYGITVYEKTLREAHPEAVK
jgi:DNA repair photolyase